jgi:Flp pilus assembly secretin CpaC
MGRKFTIAFCVAAITALLAASARIAFAQPKVVRIAVGKTATLRFKQRILSIHVFNPKITDVRSYTPTSLVLVGLKRGTTYVEVKFKGRTVRFKVQVVKKNE